MNESNNSKPNDEIDIFEFSSRIWLVFKNFLASIWNFIISVFVFLLRKSLWIMSFGFAGVLIGCLLYGISPSAYVSSLEADTGGVDNSVVINHINKLNKVVDKPDLLANYLGLSLEQADAIHSIKAYYGIDINKDGKPDYIDFSEKYNPRDTNQIRVPSFVHVMVSLYDESVLPDLRMGLFQYIENNEYLQKLFKIDKEQKDQLVKELNTEIAKIDTLRKVQLLKDLTPDKGQTVVIGNIPETKLFYTDMLLLYERKQGIEKSLTLNTEIILVVQDFTRLQQEEKTATNMAIKYGIAMAIMGLFCAFLWQYRIIIWKLITENSTKR